ncbi:MAG: hypothetical protein AB8H80_05910 [Planctomycetota bacterium]
MTLQQNGPSNSSTQLATAPSTDFVVPDVTGMPVFQAVPVLQSVLQAYSVATEIQLNGSDIDLSVQTDLRSVTNQSPVHTGQPVQAVDISLTAVVDDPDHDKIYMPNLVGLTATAAVAALAALRAIALALYDGVGFDVETRDESGDPVLPPFGPNQRVRTTIPAEDGLVRPGDTVAVIVFDIGG